MPLSKEEIELLRTAIKRPNNAFSFYIESRVDEILRKLERERLVEQKIGLNDQQKP